jgi:hypothetical protein
LFWLSHRQPTGYDASGNEYEMFRVMKMGHSFYATEVNSVEDDAENIQKFVDDAVMVILVEEIEDAEKLFDVEIEVV